MNVFCQFRAGKKYDLQYFAGKFQKLPVIKTKIFIF